ncbi:hypothetical protein HDU76_002603 [Blyttiomyces sp. JEL0837]|nr:hypothetical protein HDU76_002603 [Blyttiomyces sp. JEL0837]
MAATKFVNSIISFILLTQPTWKRSFHLFTRTFRSTIAHFRSSPPDRFGDSNADGSILEPLIPQHDYHENSFNDDTDDHNQDSNDEPEIEDENMSASAEGLGPVLAQEFTVAADGVRGRRQLIPPISNSPKLTKLLALPPSKLTGKVMKVLGIEARLSEKAKKVLGV